MVVCGCGAEARDEMVPTGAAATDAAEGSGDSGDSGETGGVKLDIAPGDSDTAGEPGPSCKVVDEMDGVGPCGEKAPPDSFEPDVQWEWWGEGADVQALVTPLVANLTDDDANGAIDLCDIPDVVVVATADVEAPGHVYVLDGATGQTHFGLPGTVDPTVTPALGDIDGDGKSELLAADEAGFIVAFENDGTPKWQSDTPWSSAFVGALAIADMDNDLDPEIIAGNQVFSSAGKLKWTAGEPASPFPTSTAADLDDDGALELVLGHAAYHADGAVAWVTAVEPGFPQVADLDDDGHPEVLVTNPSGISMIEHDGQVKYQNLTPTGDAPGGLVWSRPATIHDFDGDLKAEFAVSSGGHYSVYEGDASIVWSADVLDVSGIAAGTAFDFLGDGTAEAMYADEGWLFVFDSMGKPLLETPRQSRTGTEYPVVADIDNDGSAEIVVVSSECAFSGNCPMKKAAAVQAVRDADDRWIQARRIWNQHAYHVTNVREDGTIPQFESPSWELLDTFRTQAQIDGGGVCKPVPEG